MFTPQRSCDPVAHLRLPGRLRAMCAAIELVAGLHPVPDDLHAAELAVGRDRLYGALHAVENMRPAALDHLERLVIVVAADFAFHIGTSLAVAHGARWSREGFGVCRPR